MKKRILSVLIAVVMLILILPTAVFAADSHTHCICGATHVSVGNHNAAVSTTFTAVKNQTELQNAATNGGNVYLANNITIDSTINVTGNLTLCLNGYTLKNTATNMRVININSGTLNLTDCRSSGTITGGSFNSDGGGVYNNATFNMYGGVISNNTANRGGGVYNNHTFTMYGGVISQNTANNGGGVYNSYSFTMTGGSIINNTANSSPSGGIYLNQYLTLSGKPVISQNKYGSSDGDFDIYKNYTAIKVTEDFAPTGSPIKVSVDSSYNDRVFLEVTGSSADVENYIGYFENISEFPLYKNKNDGKYYAGFAIVENPTSENDYTVKVSSNNDLSCQWYKKISGIKVLTDSDVALWYGEYDTSSQSFTVSSPGLMGEILLNAGDQLIVSSQFEIDAELDGMDLPTVEQDGNTYTFTVPSTDYYLLRVIGNSGESVKLTKNGSDFVEVEGQTALTLDKVNLEVDDYKCKLVWNRGTDDSYDDIEAWSEVVTYTKPIYTITWNVDGNITTEQYEYGATPSFKGSTDKAADAQYTYTFAGWNTEISEVTGNATYTATYNSSLRTYGATVGESLHGSVTLTPDSTLVGDTITVTITPEAGYAVDTVTVTGTTATKVTENKYTFSMPTTDVVVNVTYKKIPYNVSAFGGGSATGGSYFVDKASATVGDTITITVAPNLGYLVEKVTFNGIAATNNGDGTYSFTMPAQEVIVSVEFDIDLPAISNELQKLNDADAALTEAMTDKDNDLTDEITALSNAIVSAQNAINVLDNSYATDAQLDALKTALEAADNTMTNAINALESRVQDIEDALNGIDLSQIATNKQDIVDLTTELNNVKATVNQLDNTFINNTELANALATLKGELEYADDALEALITALTESVNKLKDDLNTANGKIDTNASDISTLKTDVSTLKAWKTEAQAAIDSLEALTTTQGTNISALQTAVADLQTAVNTANGKITSAENRIAVLEGKVADLETATANLQNAVTTLQTAVAGKADTATVTAAIADLQTAIDALEAAKNNYVGADDTLRAELEAAIATAKGEAISAAEALVNNAKTELQSKIDAKADAATTAEAIQNLQAAVAALEAVKDDYATADANLKAELEAAIERAKQEAIEASKGYIPYIGTNGNWWIGDTDTGVDANGIKGDTGATGADGVGIAKIEKTSSDGNVDIYTITLTNGTTYTFTITNGTNGTNDVDEKGSTDGADDQTPYVGENGNWCIGNTDTGVNAIVVATAVGGTALISNIALIAWELIKKKRFF